MSSALKIFLKNVFSKYSFSSSFTSSFLFQTFLSKCILTFSGEQGSGVGVGVEGRVQKLKSWSEQQKEPEVNSERFSRPSLGPEKG